MSRIRGTISGLDAKSTHHTALRLAVAAIALTTLSIVMLFTTDPGWSAPIGFVASLLWGATITLLVVALNIDEDDKEGPGLFCRDCGRPYETALAQDGFDPRTGQPLQVSERRCPNRSITGKSWAFDRDNRRDCGQRIKTEYGRAVHAHAGSFEASCIACIDGLAVDRVLPSDEVRRLYRKAGVEP